MSRVIYKYINDIERLLATIWSSYPTVYIREVSEFNEDSILSPLTLISNEICEGLNNGNIIIRSFQKGAVGQVGPMLMLQNGEYLTLSVHNISISQNGTWIPYYTKVLAKNSIKPEFMFIRVDKNDNIIRYTSNNFIHESIIGGLVSNLFDIGVCPHLTKIYGLYVCPFENYIDMYSNVTLIDENTVRFYDIFSGIYKYDNNTLTEKYLDIFLDINKWDIMIWMMQSAQTFFIMKYYYGIVHFDTHQQNTMLTKVKQNLDTIRSEDDVTAMYYGGKNMQEVDYIQYELPFYDSNGNAYYIVVENNGYIFRLIDYGLTYSDFGKSVNNKDTPMIFMANKEIYMVPTLANEALEQGKHGDIEYNFTAYNMLFQLQKIIINDTLPENIRYKALNLYNEIKPFLSSTINNYEQNVTRVDDSNRTWTYETLLYSDRWFMAIRDVGTTTDITSSLKNIYNYLNNIGMTRGNIGFITRKGVIPNNVNTERILTIPINTSNNVRNKDLYSRFNTAAKLYYDVCVINKNEVDGMEGYKNYLVNNIYPDVEVTGRDDLCELGSRSVNSLNPNNTVRKSLFGNNVTPSSKIWDLNTIRKNIKILELGDFLIYDLNSVRIYSLEFYPDTYNMGVIAKEQYLNFKITQRMLDFNPPNTFLQNRLMSKVTIHLIYYDNNNGDVSIINGDDLYTNCIYSLSNYNRGIVINGNYFVVMGNIKNPLTPGLEDYLRSPIGYYYNQYDNELNGTVLPIPQAYREDWCTVYIHNNKINLIRLTDFYRKHRTIKRVANYQLVDDDGNNIRGQEGFYQTEVEVIALNDNNDPITIEPFNYDYAFDTGPILIWNGQLIMSQNKMVNKEFRLNMIDNPPINDTIASDYDRYKVFPYAYNTKMYYNEPGEKSNYFIYGQRHSNSLINRSVLCETYDGYILFVLLEGRGYETLGLDSPQLTELISKFNVKNAVSLDSGFSVNCVIKNDKNIKWLIPDPEKRPMGISIAIGSK